MQFNRQLTNVLKWYFPTFNTCSLSSLVTLFSSELVLLTLDRGIAYMCISLSQQTQTVLLPSILVRCLVKKKLNPESFVLVSTSSNWCQWWSIVPLLQCSEYISRIASVPEVHMSTYTFLATDGYRIRIADVYGDLWSKNFDRWVKLVEIGSSSVVSITVMHR